MKPLLTITAVFEAATGIAVVLAPSRAALLLLGSPLDSPAAVVIARVLGAALFSLGTACWFARTEAPGRSSAGLIGAMLIYNVPVAVLLGYARVALGMSGVGLLPAAIAHSALAVWCVVGLANQSPGEKTQIVD